MTDLVEVSAGTDPQSDTDSPLTNGDFVFTEPYKAPPEPDRYTLSFATDIKNADVLFAIDTTGSMTGEISSLKNAVKKIAGSLAESIPSIGLGVGYFRDFPAGECGHVGDKPWKLLQRITTVNTPEGLALVQTAAGKLSAGGGIDTPESTWQALHHIATGVGFGSGINEVEAFDPSTAEPVTPLAGEALGTIGGAGFRAGALPIVILISDAPGHNDDVTGGAVNAYTTCAPSGTTFASAALDEINDIGARIIGVASQGGLLDPRPTMVAAATQTGALVPPAAWGPDGDRPNNCGTAKCCTGVLGVGEPAVSGNCPLVFTVDPDGQGLGDSIVTAIKALSEYAPLDIGASVADDPSDNVNAVTAFIDRLEPNANPSDLTCAQGLPTADTNGDGKKDTFLAVTPGTKVCFDLVAKSNTTVQPKVDPQMFKAFVSVIGGGVTVLDTRDVFFLVPPEFDDTVPPPT